LQPIDFGKGEHKTPEYIEKQQPFGQIPVLHQGDYKLYESNAIARYLAAAYDTTNTVLPKDAKLLGEVEQFISVEMCNYRASDIVFELVFKKYGGGTPDTQKVDNAFKKVTRVLEVLETHFASKKQSNFLVGNHFTIADIVFMPYTQYLLKIEQFKNTLDKYPNVNSWWKNISGRPSWQKVLSLK